jgi:uncharacterized protein
MSKIILGEFVDLNTEKPVQISLETLLRTRMLVQANSGGGKSWLLRRLAEQTVGEMQLIIIDPEGEFSSLRSCYPFALAGQGGETPVDPETSGALARRLLELRISAVCDLYELKATDRRLWVKNFLEGLVDSPRRLWSELLVIVDEASLFAPNKTEGDAEGAADAVIELVARGRKRPFGSVLATQRLSKLRTDVASELTNVLIGRTFLDVDRWRAAESLGVMQGDKQEFHDRVRQLAPGMFFGLGPAFGTEERFVVEVGRVETPHQSSTGRRRRWATPLEIMPILPELQARGKSQEPISEIPEHVCKCEVCGKEMEIKN